MTEATYSQDVRVRALIAIALTEKLAHELDEHTERLRALVEAEKERGARE